MTLTSLNPLWIALVFAGAIAMIITLAFAIRQRRLNTHRRTQIRQLSERLEQALLPNAPHSAEIPPLDDDLVPLIAPLTHLLIAHANQDHDRYQVLVELARGLNHNMNNLLFGILGAAQLIERHSDNEEIISWARVAYTDGQKLTDLVKQLTDAVTEHVDQPPDNVDLNRNIVTLLNIYQPRWLEKSIAEGRRVNFQTDLANPCAPIHANPGGITRMLEELLKNSLDALVNGGTIILRTFQPNPLEVCLEVRDNGIGMDSDTRRRIFDPFFTTKKNLGTGLGLSKVMTTVLQWDGAVAVTSVAGNGTSVVVTFPASSPSNQTLRGEDLTNRHARVAVIDDQPVIRAIVANALDDNFEVIPLDDAESALQQFQPGQWQVAMIDLGLPGMSGDQLAKRLGELDPKIIRIMMTGWAVTANDPRRDNFEYHIQKPVTDITRLNQLVSDALHHPRNQPADPDQAI